ncbi:hypothetical protein WI40_00600 [Burkholderia ubonensis]|uniref:hypothetical protein n=1 Tax=Burkholderia ubonensis TaxID=101571 RepID=UPI000759F8E1|nr:hypothetical protein [Burkholderia ubonensis]KVA01028.1 hypothetical protein WI40_00600 [Burkholderia ubonensis]
MTTIDQIVARMPKEAQARTSPENVLDVLRALRAGKHELIVRPAAQADEVAALLRIQRDTDTRIGVLFTSKECADRWQARAADTNETAAEPSIPAGWKLVPIHPSGTMRDAGHWSLPVGIGGPWTAAAVYQAMIDNAPPPPAQANADDSEGRND